MSDADETAQHRSCIASTAGTISQKATTKLKTKTHTTKIQR